MLFHLSSTSTLIPMHRINAKLGGVNMALSPGGANAIIDPSNPVIVMGKSDPVRNDH